MTLYSTVIPIYNEVDTLPELWRRLSAIFEQLDGHCEAIFVNDGSSDGSGAWLEDLSDRRADVKVLHLSRNFGHQPALAAGLAYAEGDAVVLMDGDLQDDPAAILDFVDRWEQGYDVVYAVRRKRKERWVKRLAFRGFYRLQHLLSEVAVPLDAGIFSLLDRRVVLALRQMPERNKYLSGLRAYAGFQQVGVVVDRGPRYSGEPRVSWQKLVKLALDGIFSFSTLPLRLVTYLGVFFSFSAFLLGTVGLYFKYVKGVEFLAWPHGLTTTFFTGGIQLLSLGIIGEYVGRIYEEVKQRPYFIVAKETGFESRAARPREVPPGDRAEGTARPAPPAPRALPR